MHGKTKDGRTALVSGQSSHLFYLSGRSRFPGEQARMGQGAAFQQVGQGVMHTGTSQDPPRRQGRERGVLQFVIKFYHNYLGNCKL